MENETCSPAESSGGSLNGTTAPPVSAEAGSGSSSPSEAAPSSSADTSAPSADAASPKKIKFTSKIKRGLALMRMVNITALDENGELGTPMSAQRIMDAMTKRQQEEYDAAMQWIDQEEDWDAVAEVWTKAGGK
jgi:hypothetical protein